MSEESPPYGNSDTFTKKIEWIVFGMKFVRYLNDGEMTIAHPNGHGVLIAHPERKMMWCRMEGSNYVETVVDPTDIQ